MEPAKYAKHTKKESLTDLCALTQRVNSCFFPCSSFRALSRFSRACAELGECGGCQRKVAVAEFEAVVSGDIYVLAPNHTQRLLPDLLPFLCLSERFFQHAVGTSAGSLSPRTNWSSLASFGFDLPPLDQQRRIAEILWAVDESLNRYLET